jgi:chaperonin GroES
MSKSSLKVSRPDLSSLIVELKEKVSLLGDRILVQPHTIETQTASGILLPKVATDDVQPTEGTALVVSDKITEEAKSYERVDPGDVVLYSKYAGYDVEVGGVSYKCLRITDVIGILRDTKE